MPRTATKIKNKRIKRRQVFPIHWPQVVSHDSVNVPSASQQHHGLDGLVKYVLYITGGLSAGFILSALFQLSK